MGSTNLDGYCCTLPGSLVDSAIRTCAQEWAHLHIIKGFPLELPVQAHISIQLESSFRPPQMAAEPSTLLDANFLRRHM